jgi:voltage-gated potassium channel
MDSKVPKTEEESVALTAIIIVAVVSIAFFVISIHFISGIFGNAYVGSYYTISVLFDAVGFYPAVAVPFLSGEFYSFAAVLVMDGIVRIIIVGFLIASMIELASKINLKSRFSIITARRLKGHIIICGYSSFGERLAKDLLGEKKRFVIIEKDRSKVDMLRDIGYLAIEGDFTRDVFLREASIRDARAVVLDSGNDFEDVLAIIAMRRMNRSVKIIARVNSEVSITSIEHAGADQCLIPEILAGAEMGSQIVRVL